MCHTHTYYVRIIHTHAVSSYITYAVSIFHHYMPFTVSRITLDTESLLTTFTRIYFFNAMHESYSLLPFLGETCQHLYALHTHTHTVRISYMLHVQQTRSTFLQCKNCYSLEHTTRSFPSRNIAFGSCICFEEQFLSCDSLRPIRTYGAINWNLDFFLVSFIDPFPRECF